MCALLSQHSFAQHVVGFSKCSFSLVPFFEMVLVLRPSVYLTLLSSEICGRGREFLLCPIDPLTFFFCSLFLAASSHTE